MRRRDLLRCALFAPLAACRTRGDERAIVVYSCGPRPLAERLARSFETRSGTRVELFCATSGEILARVEAERFRPRVDVLQLASPLAARWLGREGRLERFAPRNLGAAHAAWRDEDLAWCSTGASWLGVAVRRESGVAGYDWEDFLDGRFGRRVSMPSPARSGSSADFMTAFVVSRGDAAFDSFRRARSRGLEIVGANSQALTLLRIGAHGAILGAADYLVFEQVARGEPLGMHWPASGSVLVPRPIAVLATSRRKDDARAFVEHCLEIESQEEVARAHLLPARIEVEPSPERAAAGAPVAVLELPWDIAADRQRAILRRFRYEIERAPSPERDAR